MSSCRLGFAGARRGSVETMLDVVLIIAGLVFLVLMMAFVLNPPEAWIKRVFLRDRKR